jgi:hypothetical protein
MDNLDGPIAPACVPASGATFPIATTMVTCTATDAHGNTGTAAFPVTVADTVGPVVTVPAGMVVEASGPLGAAVSFAVSATDNIDGAIAVTCSPASGSTFPLGTTDVTCTATDAHNNSGTATFPVTVRDTTPPVITTPNAVSTLAPTPLGVTVNYAASATDLVNGQVPVSCTPASGSVFPIAVTTVNCSATDAAGNGAVRAFNVTVTLKPLDAPATLTVGAMTKSTAMLHWTPGADGLAIAYRIYVLEDKPGNNVPVWVLVVDGVKGLSYLVDKFKQPNKTHRFAVTAMDAFGRESIFSAPVDVTLPRK